MKSNWILTLLLMLLINTFACKEKEQTHLAASWSSKDPITIPYSTRLNYLNLGNLVQNPSFESGKLLYHESSIKTFAINNWKHIGENTQWVNKQNRNNDSCEVFHGNHSIKIHRTKADETETIGEGVFSDYIKVIPGNYLLKMYLRLKNIKSHQERLGFKLYDAVNIRIKYYDKNKIEVQANNLNFFQDKKIDQTFGSLSFANYNEIVNMNWCEVHAKTAFYPYYNGDIPDNVKYVRLFIGLKGTGTLCVDKVDFRYTKNNFSLKERLKPYVDSSYSAYDMILPVPKQITQKQTRTYYVAQEKKVPVIVMRSKNNMLKTLVDEFKNKIEYAIQTLDSLHPKIEIVENIKNSQLEKYSLVISIGDNQLSKKYQTRFLDSLHKSDEAYCMQMLDNSNLLLLNASKEKGLYNGLLTLMQLFDNNKPLFYSANIIDWPDFDKRCIIVPEKFNEAEKLQMFSKYKINSVYFNSNRGFGFKKMPYFTKNMYLDLDFNETLSCIRQINDKQFNKIATVLIKSDSFSVNQIERIKNAIKQRNKTIKIEILPQYHTLKQVYKNKEKAIQYFGALYSKFNNVDFVWTGENNCSNTIDCFNVKHFSNFTRTLPILFDNELLKSKMRLKTNSEKRYYAGKLRLQSIFEPYNLNAVNECYKNKKSKIILNVDSLSGFQTIRILTAANYYWNTNKYNPEKTLWIILNKYFDKRTAIGLLEFNDAVFGIREMSQKIDNGGLNNKNERIINAFKLKLEKYYDLLNNKVSNPDLLTEIVIIKKQVHKEYNRVLKKIK